MSSAASRPPHSMTQSVNQSSESDTSARAASSGTASSDGLRKPPNRPQLMGPPARPKPPEPTPEPVATQPAEPKVPARIGPISAPSERMQYRAIGLLQGKYVASEEQLNRGNIEVEDGTLVDAVLLGRVTSLIKKHIDLETNHLWVVYPRTLYTEENEPALHVQIVGVWEPETLNANKEDSEEGPKYLSTAEASDQCDTFSVRGEIAKYDEEKSEIVVNIVQKSKSETVKPKRPFKLLISGKLNGRATGYFWDLKVAREEGQLVLVESTQVGVVPPKKKSARDARGKEGARRRPPGGKPKSSAGAPVPKPVPKPKSASRSEEKAIATQSESGSTAGEQMPPQTEPIAEVPVDKAIAQPTKSDTPSRTKPIAEASTSDENSV
ncbi:MAG: hypothetical protein WA885_16565 [Phormidesmis sp.]